MKPGKCLDRIVRMKAVEREYGVAIAARERPEASLGDRSINAHKPGLKLREFRGDERQPGFTYLIRLFAEFEAGMIDYWNNGLGKKK